MNTLPDVQPVPHSVSLLVVATGRYQQFVPQVLASASRHVRGLDRVFLFTDQRPDQGLEQVVWLPWGHLGWPLPTLLRYRAFSAYRDVLETSGVLLYVDVDMRFADDIDMSDVSGLLAVEHPGYVGQAVGGLPYERRPESACCVPAGAAEAYFCGGVQGGQASQYLDACAEMASWIQSDLDHNIIPVWHDESAWNRYCALNPPKTIWGPEYCSPEHEGNLAARIIALDKNHDAVRGTPWLRRRVVGARRFAGRARRAAVKVRRVAQSPR